MRASNHIPVAKICARIENINEVWFYDSANRLTNITHSYNGGANTLQSYTYGHSGRATTKEVREDGQGPPGHRIIERWQAGIHAGFFCWCVRRDERQCPGLALRQEGNGVRLLHVKLYANLQA